MIRVPIDKADYEEIAVRLWQEHGIEIASPTGVIVKNGVTANYTYDGATLAVTVIHAPFPFSNAYCEEKIQHWLIEKTKT